MLNRMVHTSFIYTTARLPAAKNGEAAACLMKGGAGREENTRTSLTLVLLARHSLNSFLDRSLKASAVFALRSSVSRWLSNWCIDK